MTSRAADNAGHSDETFARREQDWRNGAITYQVIVDRFAPSARLEEKRGLYPAPKVLRAWSDVPQPGVHLPEHRLYSHEIEFWGGDLASLSGRLDYIAQLGADVLYLTPIHTAYTNHKYDALDFQQISPEYGSREDVVRLAADVHGRGMKLVLDGVFNHMGRNAPIFQHAITNPASPWRDWFALGPQYGGGARAWVGAPNLPELNLENPLVRRYIYAAPDSVVRSYLRDGADGWRLDTAFELGYRFLAELTQAAHEEKPGSLVIGEIVNYPDRWLQGIDAVMNFSLRYILIDAVTGTIPAATAARRIDRMVADCGVEPLLKSWTLIDNHDRPRIATELPRVAQRRLAQLLQFTLPGSPNLYYGAEVGMTGGEDPANRGPMRWDLVRDDNPELAWIKRLIGLRKQHRALRIGDFRLVDADHLLAFERYTDRAREAVVVVVNASPEPVTEPLMVPDASLMDDIPMVDLLAAGDARPVAVVKAGFLKITVPPQTACVLVPRETAQGGYSRFKRVP